MAEPHYLEECCWDWIRDQCSKDGRCACRCHTEEAAHVGPQPDEMVRLQQALDATEEEVARLQMVRDAAERKVARLENLLARAYPWLHNPYRAADGSAFDFALAVEGDGIISDVEVAIQHLPDDKER